MKEKLLSQWPELRGKVMTIRGFVQGFWPDNEQLSEAEGHIKDAAGHGDKDKLALYEEIEVLAQQISNRLATVYSGPLSPIAGDGALIRRHGPP